MKNKFLYFSASAVLATVGLVACNDLDTMPASDYVTTSQKAEAINLQPDLASAGVVGISSGLTTYNAVYSNHIDFGWPSVMLLLDNIGPDLVSLNIGYNWFASSGTYNFGNNNNYMNNMGWYHCYKIIKSANDVVGNVDPDTDNPELQLFGSQGYANRAFMYFQLAQMFQYTYKGHESLPCVPIVTELNANDAAAGIGRSTVEEVYQQALDDINKAIEWLEACNLSVSEIANKGIKRFVSLGAAYGIRARINLVMNNWQAAADDAAKAIAASGATPLSIAEAGQPGFSDSNDHNWMWAIYVDPSDDVVATGIINFPSHMGSFNSNGYWSVGAFRKINVALYNSIPATDCRKGWWLDEEGLSSNLNETQQSFITEYETAPYTQVKFGPYQGVVGTTTNANDVPLMRVEEMYLIQAEATAMAGNPAGGKQILVDFVQTYRDPSYSTTASSATEVQEAVWMQRRIELWGEGFCYFDLLRLNKGLDRRGGGYETTWVYNVPAPLKPFLIPNQEMETNAAITSNNDTWDRPTAVDDL
ncbi:MAG: RagB/SusD family nutrient uptake outer membrane protein [Muribaculaceae bacterium]|nr:RagB/SusD family nutrient uptake outer membrane protein [Muribaculaceae bacterium]